MNKAKVIEALNMTIEGLTIIRDEIATDGGNAVAPATPVKEERSKVIQMPLPVEEAEETVKGHFSREDLDAMKFNDLKKLGASLGVKCSGTRDQIVERILAVEVEVAVEDVEAVEEVPVEEEPKKASKKVGKKKAEPVEEPVEEEEVDEYLEYAKELAEDMSVEELKEALADAGIKVKSKKKDVLVKELAKALEEGLIEVEDDEEESEEVEEADEAEGEEITADAYYDYFDPEGYNDPESMTKKRRKACLELATNALEQIKSGKMSMDDVFDYVEDNTTDEEKELLDETPAHDEVVAFFLELLKRTVDNDGEVHDPSDPYEIGDEVNMCCGHELKYDKKSKNYICEICGTEYEAE